MITMNSMSERAVRDFLEFYGLSTDSKPVGQFGGVRITNGSLFNEMDTACVYIYDETSSEWNLMEAHGGGGGGLTPEQEEMLLSLADRAEEVAQ